MAQHLHYIRYIRSIVLDKSSDQLLFYTFLDLRVYFQHMQQDHTAMKLVCTLHWYVSLQILVMDWLHILSGIRKLYTSLD